MFILISALACSSNLTSTILGSSAPELQKSRSRFPGCSRVDLQLTQFFINLVLERGCQTLKLGILQTWQQAPNSGMMVEYVGFVDSVVEVSSEDLS